MKEETHDHFGGVWVPREIWDSLNHRPNIIIIMGNYFFKGILPTTRQWKKLIRLGLATFTTDGSKKGVKYTFSKQTIIDFGG